MTETHKARTAKIPSKWLMSLKNTDGIKVNKCKWVTKRDKGEGNFFSFFSESIQTKCSVSDTLPVK